MHFLIKKNKNKKAKSIKKDIHLILFISFCLKQT